ncbi:MAG: YqaE/Pmp3 family membrane protein [Bacteroidota bacterium]
MKKSLSLFVFLLASIGIVSAVHSSPNVAALEKSQLETLPAYESLSDDIKNMSLEDFLNLTPKQYKKMTGKRLGFKNAVALKIVQKAAKKKKDGKLDSSDIPKPLFIICAIFIPIVAVIFMGLMDDWETNNWWIALILYFLFYIPGLIFTLIKMKDYY